MGNILKVLINKFNTSIRNGSLHTILHVHGCLFRDRVKTTQWLALSNDITGAFLL